MMELANYLKPELVRIGLNAIDKWDVLDKMASILADSGKVHNLDELRKALYQRERTMTTGIGRAIAIPHASCSCVDEIVVAAATLTEPIDFESLDFVPVSVVFAIACPQKRGKAYMELLSQIARLFADTTSAEKIRRAKTPEEFVRIIVE